MIGLLVAVKNIVVDLIHLLEYFRLKVLLTALVTNPGRDIPLCQYK